MSWDDLSHGRDDWPPVSKVHEYRQISYKKVREVIEKHPGLEPGCKVGWNDPCWAIFMGFEHERIHIETSSVLIREVRRAWTCGGAACLHSGLMPTSACRASRASRRLRACAVHKRQWV